ncbi:TniQ family protein [Hylemonella sp. W303a]|uniref:TniQ family protein n=1 Tax=Hylemonella sp. W303a TaxID=3389873 RepID=UPI00396B0828
MKGLTSSLWPVRYKPYPDELLTSWLVRLAWGHGLKVQTFCNLIFGGQRQVWNRDVDRLGPDWLVNELADRTGTPRQVAHATTLRAYEGVLYPKFRTSGTLLWVQTLMMYHRKREGFGLQFCPVCLAEDDKPYYRKSWRVSFNTMCIRHQVMLRDRCAQCGAPVIFHRMEMGQGKVSEVGSMGNCHACGCPLADSPREEIWGHDDIALDFHADLCRAIAEEETQSVDLDVMRVMHQLVRLMLTRHKTVALRQHVCRELQVKDLVKVSGRVGLETMPLMERHHLVQLVSWLMVDLAGRLEVAWRARAVRYNHLGRDFEGAPNWYRAICEQFADWRGRLAGSTS